MSIKIFISILYVFLYFTSIAQKQNQKWTIGVNPLSIAEPAVVLGPSVAYSVSPKIDLWTEVAYIFKKSYLLPTGWSNLNGYRFLFQSRYFLDDDREIFVAAEFRLKHQSFQNNGKLNFTNDLNDRDTFSISNFKESQNLIGGAILFGKQIELNEKKHIFLEFTGGLGIKDRIVDYHNKVPNNYKNNLIEPRKYALSASYQNPETTFYLPFAIRIFWKIN